MCVYSQSIATYFAETTFCSYNIFLPSDYAFSSDPVTLQLGAPRTAGAAQLGSPESSLSPHSDLSVPSVPTRSAQSLSSYNPFEDEDDTGSTVSEKEDIKAKKLVNRCFPLVFTSLALSPSLCPGSRPLGTDSSMRPAGGGRLPAGRSLAFPFRRAGGTVNNPCCFPLSPINLVQASAQEDGPRGGALEPPALPLPGAGAVRQAACRAVMPRGREAGGRAPAEGVPGPAGPPASGSPVLRALAPPFLAA